jgi:hypothetical protein
MPGSLNTVNHSSVMAGRSSIVASSKTRGAGAEANRTDMLTKPYQKYIKVVDPDTKDAQGRARIVGRVRE